MSGLREQIKPENKRYYDTSRFNLEATKTFAANLAHFFITAGKIDFIFYAKLKNLIDSEDIESVRLAIYMMETEANENFTTKEETISTQNSTQDGSNIHSREPQIPELRS